MRVLLAPDKFKGTLTAPEAARTMGSAVRILLPDAEVEERPAADGGEGTLDLIAPYLSAEERTITVRGPMGRPTEATVLVDRDRCWVESASIVGLSLLTASSETSRSASTDGIGDALRRLGEEGVRGCTVFVGGTSSTDCGTGAARAIGWALIDDAGHPVAPGGVGLRMLARAIPPPELLDVEVTAACDVTDPLVGPRGTARRYAPQKGATGDDVRLLEEGVERFAELSARELGCEVANLPHGGAGGGLGAGLHAFFGARLVGAFSLVAELTGLAEAIVAADLVITGEGRFDASSLAGKVPLGVARLARAAGVPCLVVAGRSEVDLRHLGNSGIQRIATLDPRLPPAQAVGLATQELVTEWMG